ncbi:MAG: acyl carrier protein [Chloroflexi bacterium]|nr:acyl carrier protein [Chloroflexota bacterium]
MITHQAIKKQVRTFVFDNFIFDEETTLGDDDSFLENRIIDSTGVLELIMFVEETFGIEVADEEVIPENLDSLERLAEYVMRKVYLVAAA